MLIKSLRKFTPARARNYSFFIQGNDLSIQSFRQTSAGNVVCANTNTCGRINNRNGDELAVQGTAGFRPTYNTNQVNGHGALVPDGTDDFLTLNTNRALGGDWLFGAAWHLETGAPTVFLGGNPGGDLQGIAYDPSAKSIYVYDDYGSLEGNLVSASWPATEQDCAVAIQRVGNVITANLNGVIISVTTAILELTIKTLFQIQDSYSPSPLNAMFLANGTANPHDFDDVYNFMSDIAL